MKTTICTFLLAAIAASIQPLSALADTEVVDGIEWYYTAADGKATIRGRDCRLDDYYGYFYEPSISTAVSGLVTIPCTLGGYPVSRIDDGAFFFCSNILAITISDSVTSIGRAAFYECSSLKSVIMHDSVKSVGYSIFWGCKNLEEMRIIISDMAKWVTNSVNSKLGGTRRLFKDGSEVLDLIVPDGTISIGDSAFSYCRRLKSVTIPDSVTNIGASAFDGCSGLESVVIPESVTSIGNNAFSGCENLKSVVVPGRFHLSSIFPNAYSSITNVVVVSDGSENIINNAFKNCSGMTSVTIPDSVLSIGDEAFNGCSSLPSITIPGSVTNIGGSAFRDCRCLPLVTIPNNVLSIGSGAFFGCSNLCEISIPNNVESLGNEAFSGCSGLTALALGTGITSIGNKTFYGCTSLQSATIPNSVTNIGDSAFQNCTNLCELTLSENLARIENDAFNGCSGLLSVRIPDSVTSIGVSAFSGCGNLALLTIGNGVTSIEGGTFRDCCSLTSVVVPDKVTSIRENAFCNCSSLSSVTIPDSVTEIRRDAFFGCNGLAEVHITNVAAWCRVSFGNYSNGGYYDAGDFDSNPLYYARHLFLNGEEVTNLIIPNGATGIANKAFIGCCDLMSVVIPDSVTEIGSDAFRDCTNLTSVAIGDGVTSIGGGAFYGCNSLAELSIPDNVRSVDWSALNGNDGLRILTVGTGIDKIARESLLQCRNLTTVYLPNGCTYYTGESRQYNSSTHSYYYLGPTFPAGCKVIHYDTYDLEVVSEFGEPVPSIGHNRLHTHQNPIHCSVPVSEIPMEDGMKRVCVGWTGTGSVPISGMGTEVWVDLSEDSSITWVWQTNVWIDCIVDGDAAGMTVGQWASPGGEGATIKFTPSGNLFTCLLSGDTDGVSVDARTWTITVPADRPRSVTVSIVSGEAAAATGDYPITLDESTNAVPWHPVADATANDGMSLRSGEVEAGGTSSFETELDGPGTLSFDWRISANRWDYLKVYVDDEEQMSITQEASWETVSLDIQGGAHIVRWSYERGRLGAAGENAAFLDNISWSPLRTYTVRFNANGGSGSMAAQSIMRGATAKLNGNKFTREGHAFFGWAESASGPVAYENMATIKDIAAVGDTVTLYAVWLERNGTAADYLDAPELEFTTSGGPGWAPDEQVWEVGGGSLSSGILPPSEILGEWTNTTLRTVVSGEGSLSFWWKVNCEEMDEEYGDWWDFATFTVDGVEMARIAGDSSWRQVECEIAGRGMHTLEWTFWRDDYDEDGAVWENCLWVDGVEWHRIPVTLSLGSDGRIFTTGGDADWSVDVENGWTNGVSAKSGAVASGQSSWIETTVVGAGKLSFHWKVMGGIYRNNPFAYAKVEVDGVNVAQTHLTDGWAGQTLTVEGAGEHTVRWTYLRTSARPADGDCAWLDAVEWVPAAAESVEVDGVEVPVSWLDEYPTLVEEHSGSHEAAANATAANGINTVADCYVAGICPTNALDLFRTVISWKDGVPVISWEPELAPEEAAKRTYRKYGRKSLTDPNENWTEINGDEALFNFFKVSVEMAK